MSERFFVTPPILGNCAALTGAETRHLASVMRAKLGDEVTLFDGSGAEFTARITAIGKQDIALSIVARREISRELPFSLAVAVALPKGDRQKWLVEKATELGVTRLVPLITERGIAEPVGSALDRLRRTVIEASKQCGRNRLMEVGEPAVAKQFFSTVSRDSTCLLADQSGQVLAKSLPPPSGPIITSIGPEGGFTADEVAVARAAGWTIVSLGD